MIKQKWEKLEIKLEDKIYNALENCLHFPTMMPVQKITIPLFLKNYDVCIEAQTGSGKTLAFLIPILNTLFLKQAQFKAKNKVFSLIIVPTRELAKQILDICWNLIQYIGLTQSVCLLIGGTKVQADINKIKDIGANIIAGTPGRLKEMIQLNIKSNNEYLHFQDLEYLILDEADRLIDQEYYESLQFIIDHLPRQKRVGLFSATLSSKKLSDLIKFGLRNPVKISVQLGQQTEQDKDVFMIPETLSNEYISFSNRFEKIIFLINYLSNSKQNKILVFMNTCASVDYYMKIFAPMKQFSHYKLFSMHGQMKQKKRNKIVQSFQNEKKAILIATDVVARGIDFDNINTILQVDPPQDPNFFVHRIGRTARSGKEGNAIVLIEKHEDAFINYLKLKNVELLENTTLAINQQVSAEDIKKQIQDILISDKDIYEKSKIAFISFIRSYKEHDLKYIFEFSKLDIGNVANSFFLLRLPRIKEILGKNINNFKQSEIDPDQIQFQDKNQEKQFLESKDKRNQLKQEKEEKKKEFKQKMQEKMSYQPRRKDVKNVRQERKKLKRQNQAIEYEDYGKELNLVKKLKSGKITIDKYKEEIKDIDPQDLQDEKFTKKMIVSTQGHKKKKK